MTTVDEGTTGALDAGAHQRIEAWTAEHVPEATPPLTFDLVAAGGSNLTFRVDDAKGDRWALRRPPAREVLATAHDVAREYRIISALGDSVVPVPLPDIVWSGRAREARRARPGARPRVRGRRIRPAFRGRY